MPLIFLFINNLQKFNNLSLDFWRSDNCCQCSVNWKVKLFLKNFLWIFCELFIYKFSQNSFSGALTRHIYEHFNLFVWIFCKFFMNKNLLIFPKLMNNLRPLPIWHLSLVVWRGSGTLYMRLFPSCLAV